MGHISELLTRLLESYGYWVLFFALLLEMLALPLPGELLMTYAGLIVFDGKMNWLLSVIIGGTGTTLGMTIAYWVGYRLGHPFFEKHGARFHFGPDKLNGLSRWFERYGSKMLIITYFIPGVRHLTGYFSGTTRVPFRKYAAYSYFGAYLWVFLFITLGKLLGPEWKHYHAAINRYLIIFGLIAAVGYLLFSYIRKNRIPLQSRAATLLQKGLRRFRSVGKVQLLIVSASVLFLVFFALMIGLIQDFLAHEFTQFDEVASYVVRRAFTPEWMGSMENIARFGAYPLLLAPMAAAAIRAGFHNKHRWLELAFLAFAMAGGEGLDELLRRMFHRFNPVVATLSFPSEQVFMTVTVYGFSVYLLFRHHREARYPIAAVIAVVALSILVGISAVYTGINYPSDVAAGYIFGGLWVTLNIVLLEIFRVTTINGKIALKQAKRLV